MPNLNSGNSAAQPSNAPRAKKFGRHASPASTDLAYASRTRDADPHKKIIRHTSFEGRGTCNVLVRAAGLVTAPAKTERDQDQDEPVAELISRSKVLLRASGG